jgi:hypothetical protein
MACFFDAAELSVFIHSNHAFSLPTHATSDMCVRVCVRGCALGKKAIQLPRRIYSTVLAWRWRAKRSSLPTHDLSLKS